MVLDGSAPLLLYGYGSYGSSMPASFRTNILSLVDRGFVYAIAHIRGGTEKGWRWYMEGKREKKLNTFTDFTACADALAEAGYTAKGRIVARRQRRRHADGSRRQSRPRSLRRDHRGGAFRRRPQHHARQGSPPDAARVAGMGQSGRGREAFRTILFYSPYDNVRPQIYPAILALAGLTDPRVTYWEAAKWVARLRAAMTGGGPVVLKVNMDAGHGGAAGRFDRLEEVALAYAFAIKAVEGF